MEDDFNEIYSDSELVKASLKGDLDGVRKCLEQGVDPGAANNSPLVFAAMHGYLDVVKLLLEYGANVQADNGATFIVASSNGHLDIAAYLLKFGADIHADEDSAFKRSSPFKMTKFLFDREPVYFSDLISSDPELSSREDMAALNEHYKLRPEQPRHADNRKVMKL